MSGIHYRLNQNIFVIFKQLPNILIKITINVLSTRICINLGKLVKSWNFNISKSSSGKPRKSKLVMKSHAKSVLYVNKVRCYIVKLFNILYYIFRSMGFVVKWSHRKVISDISRPAKLHTFGMKVPHFTCSSHTNFPYIFYKFIHFCFSCSPCIHFFKIAAVAT